MKLIVREMQFNEVEHVVDYFLSSSDDFLLAMGADPKKLPSKNEWLEKLKDEFTANYNSKTYYYLIWLLNGKGVGHSNINHIKYGDSATMHLHLWDEANRKDGLGLKFLQKSIPFYFRHFKLKTLVCEPRTENLGPNKTLQKLGFTFVRSYETTPGPINILQNISRYELKESDLD